MPLLHVDSTWEFREVLEFRSKFAAKHGFALVVHNNEDGRQLKLNPIMHGSVYTTVMRTEALKQALYSGRYEVVFGGARRDEDAARAKERIVSVRSPSHVWDPKLQRPELWSIFNWRRSQGQTIRAFPLSNWTERDLWAYIAREQLELCSLYFSAERAVTDSDGKLIVVDDPDRARELGLGPTRTERVRFRSLGCWPVTAADRSEAADLASVLDETLHATRSERSGRVSDGRSLEAQKRDGYF